MGVTLREELRQAEINKAKSLAMPVMDGVVNKLVRFLVFHGSRRVAFTRADMAKCLVSAGERAAVGVGFALAAEHMRRTFGYEIVKGDALGARLSRAMQGSGGGGGAAGGKKKAGSGGSSSTQAGKFFVVSALEAENARRALAQSRNPAHFGLLYVICTLIFASPGRRLRMSDLYHTLHNELDERIPEEPQKRTKGPELPEIGKDMGAFLEEVRKQGYIVMDPGREAADREDPAVLLGPRFFFEMGPLQLVSAYMSVTGRKQSQEALTELIAEFWNEEAEEAEGDG